VDGVDGVAEPRFGEQTVPQIGLHRKPSQNPHHLHHLFRLHHFVGAIGLKTVWKSAVGRRVDGMDRIGGLDKAARHG